MVFVLDQRKQPLMPTTPKRARLLLARGRAVVHRVKPFVIRLRERRGGAECDATGGSQEIDPGSRATGITVARVEATPEGEVHHALFLSEVRHRGEAVLEGKQKQAAAAGAGDRPTCETAPRAFSIEDVQLAGCLLRSAPAWTTS